MAFTTASAIAIALSARARATSRLNLIALPPFWGFEPRIIYGEDYIALYRYYDNTAF